LAQMGADLSLAQVVGLSSERNKLEIKKSNRFELRIF